MKHATMTTTTLTVLRELVDCLSEELSLNCTQGLAEEEAQRAFLALCEGTSLLIAAGLEIPKQTLQMLTANLSANAVLH
jgi:hypothetical protein